MARLGVEDDAATLLFFRVTPRRDPRRNVSSNVGCAIAATLVVLVVLILCRGKQNSKFEQEGVEVVDLQVVGVEAFHAACGVTSFADVCLQTLLPRYRAHSATPEELTGILIESAAQGVGRTLAAVLANRGVSRLGFSGERVCHVTLVSSVEQLDAALAVLKTQPHYGFEEIQTRIRAAAEFHTTCIDALVAAKALEPHTVDAKQHAEKLLHNAMAVVVAFSRFGPSLLSWYPMNDDTDGEVHGEEASPSWVTEERTILTEVDPPRVDVLVAKDGSGKFKSIQGAVDAVPRNNAKLYIIGIQVGVYNEQVIVPKTATNLMFLGDGAGVAVISGNRSVAVTPGMTTFFSPSLIVEGAGFIGKGFTVRNTAAGHQQVQAVATRVSADKAAFYQCAFEGGQDVLHTHTFRQFYRECNITGTVEGRFVLSNKGAIASFQSCSMVAKN